LARTLRIFATVPTVGRCGRRNACVGTGLREPDSLIMERKMLLGIKEQAEHLAATGYKGVGDRSQSQNCAANLRRPHSAGSAPRI